MKIKIVVTGRKTNWQRPVNCPMYMDGFPADKK